MMPSLPQTGSNIVELQLQLLEQTALSIPDFDLRINLKKQAQYTKNVLKIFWLASHFDQYNYSGVEEFCQPVWGYAYTVERVHNSHLWDKQNGCYTVVTLQLYSQRVSVHIVEW